MPELKNNYAILAEESRRLFCSHDQEAMAARLGIEMTEKEIPIRYLGNQYRVERADGRVLDEAGSTAGFGATLAIYDLLCREDRPAPELSGEFVPTTSLHGIYSSHSVHEGLTDTEAQAFVGHSQALESALIACGGRQWGKGDVSYIIDVFDCFPVCVRFWDADEEFPASLQFLWDANALDFLYYETLWYVIGDLIEQLTKAL